MSKGISKIQRVILGLLDGTEKKLAYHGRGGPMDTVEILDELEERSLLNYDQPRKQRLFTVRRSCDSLQRRGLAESRYVLDPDHPGTWTISWKTAGVGEFESYTHQRG